MITTRNAPRRLASRCLVSAADFEAHRPWTPLDALTHLIPCNGVAVRHKRYVALCGETVDEHDHALDGKPTCPVCARLDAEEAIAIARLQGDR